MRINFTLFIVLILLPFYGNSQTGNPVYHADDVAALKAIAEANPKFVHRDDWLSEKPEWKGITWGESLENSRVVKVDINKPQLSVLDVRDFRELRSLNCSSVSNLHSSDDVYLSSLLINGLQHLESINCDANHLVELNLSDLPQLNKLSVGRNKLEHIELKGLTNLSKLYCRSNQLKTLDLAGVPNLTELDCADNNLIDIDVSMLSIFKRIDVSANSFKLSDLAKFLLFDYFNYSNQKEVMDRIEASEIIDYTSEASIKGTATHFKWYHSFGTEVKADNIEVLEPGKFKFKIAGEFYCEMSNDQFQNFSLSAKTVQITSGTKPYALNKPWKRKRSLGGVARKNAVGFAIGNYGYIAMGENNGLLKDFWRYNSYDDTWYRLADCPMAARKDAIGFSVNGKGYIGLGSNETEKLTDFWQYDSNEETWSHITDYPGSNTQLVSWVKYQDKIYFFCGRDVEGNYSREVWEYDPELNTWEQKKDFPGDTRISAFAYSIDDKIYLGNGQNYENGSMMTNDLWEYQADTDTWTEMDMILGYTSMSPSYFSIGSKGYYGLSGFTASKFYELDPKAESWTSSVFPYELGDQNLNDPVVFVIGAKAYFCTGSRNEGFNNESLGKELIVFDPTIPVVKPTNLLVEQLDNYQVKLTWEDQSESELSQEILYSTDGTNYEQLVVLEADIETYTTTDLELNKFYYFKVKVHGEVDDFQLSDDISINVKGSISKPTNLQPWLITLEHQWISLSWTNNSSVEKSQEVLISTDKINWNSIPVKANENSYDMMDVQPLTQYYFKVKTIGFDNSELESETISITTELLILGDLEAELVGGVNVELNWVANLPAGEKVKIYYSDDDMTYEWFGEVDSSVENFLCEELDPMKVYYFRVYSSESSYRSNAVEIKTEEAFISDLTGKLIGGLNVELNWKSATPVGEKEQIWISKDNVTFTKRGEVDPKVETFLCEDLDPMTVYYFKISTLNDLVSTTSLEIKTDIATGIEDLVQESLQVYPNPSSDYVMLKMPGLELKKISLFDRTGKLIQVDEARNELRFDVRALASGVYIIRIESDEFSATRRIVVMP